MTMKKLITRQPQNLKRIRKMKENDYKVSWVTRSGEHVKYSDMTDAHLINTYKMVMQKLDFFGLYPRKEGPNSADALHALETELKNRQIFIK